MATTTAHGFQGIIGIGDQPTVDTPVVVTEKIPFVSEDLSAQFNEILDENLCGTAARAVSQQGTQIVEGGFEFNLRYTKQQLLLRKFFGTLAVDTPVVGTNTYQLDPNIDGDFSTIAIEKTVSVWEFSAFKPSEFVLSGSPGDGIRVSVNGVAVDLELNSVINTSAVLSGLAKPGNFSLFQNTTFRVRDITAALSASDAIAISEFSLTVDRGLEATEVNDFNRLEGLENQFRDTTISFTIPRYCDNFFVNAHRNDTLLQLDITISDGTDTFLVQSPLMKITDAPAPIGGAEFVELSVEARLFPDPSGLNTFMTLQDTDSELEIQES